MFPDGSRLKRSIKEKAASKQYPFVFIGRFLSTVSQSKYVFRYEQKNNLIKCLFMCVAFSV